MHLYAAGTRGNASAMQLSSPRQGSIGTGSAKTAPATTSRDLYAVGRMQLLVTCFRFPHMDSLAGHVVDGRAVALHTLD